LEKRKKKMKIWTNYRKKVKMKYIEKQIEKYLKTKENRKRARSTLRA
jgi:hypothetical protein